MYNMSITERKCKVVFSVFQWFIWIMLCSSEEPKTEYLLVWFFSVSVTLWFQNALSDFSLEMMCCSCSAKPDLRKEEKNVKLGKKYFNISKGENYWFAICTKGDGPYKLLSDALNMDHMVNTHCNSIVHGCLWIVVFSSVPPPSIPLYLRLSIPPSVFQSVPPFHPTFYSAP